MSEWKSGYRNTIFRDYEVKGSDSSSRWRPMSCIRVDKSGYFLWGKTAGLGLVYQLTTTGRPPPDDMGGHYILELLLSMKGL